MLSSLAGIISTSPLIEQATPASKIAKWAGGKISNLMPYTLIPAPVNAEVRSLLALLPPLYFNVGIEFKYLSHDAEFNSAYLADPLIKPSGSLKGLSDMLSHVHIHFVILVSFFFSHCIF